MEFSDRVNAKRAARAAAPRQDVSCLPGLPPDATILAAYAVPLDGSLAAMSAADEFREVFGSLAPTVHLSIPLEDRTCVTVSPPADCLPLGSALQAKSGGPPIETEERFFFISVVPSAEEEDSVEVEVTFMVRDTGRPAGDAWMHRIEAASIFTASNPAAMVERLEDELAGFVATCLELRDMERRLDAGEHAAA